LAFNLVKRGAGDADSCRFGQLLKSRRYVDPFAVDGAVLLFDDIPKIDADAELHAAVLGKLAVALGELVLDSTAQSTASTALGNSARMLSPAVSINRPPCVWMRSRNSERVSFSDRRVAASSSAISRE